MQKRFLRFLVTIICFALSLTACGSPEREASGGQVYIQVTRDFGRQVFFADRIDVSPGESALEALQRHLDVQTEYGGRFVSAIEGLASTAEGGFRYDWFFYANGITASVGAGDYYPREGDVVWWDYHAWGDLFFTPAVTGAFPQPFVSGYRGNNPGTLILYTPPGREAAARIQQYLGQAGAREVKTRPYGDYNLADPQEIVMVIALWSELAGEPFWQGMLDNREKVGWFALLDNTAFTAVGLKGEEEAVYRAPVGAILVSGSGLGDPFPLWLITALDEDSLNRTAGLLVTDPQSLGRTFGVLVTEEDVIRLPR